MFDGGATDAERLVALDTSPDAVLLLQRDGLIVYANPAVSLVYGWTADEMVGTNIADLVDPQDIVQALESVKAFDAQGVRDRTPGWVGFRRPGGSYELLEIVGNPVTAGDRKLFSIFARRSVNTRVMTDVMTGLSDEPDLERVLAMIPEYMRWAEDAPCITLVWVGDGGAIGCAGDDLDPRLVGAVAASDDVAPPTPWDRAWSGEEQAGTNDDLPPDLGSLVADTGLDGYEVRPVLVGAEVRALLTVWGRPSAHPLVVYARRISMLVKLAALVLRWYDQERQVRHDAHHDGLTGLLNRRRFYQRIDDLESASGSDGRSGARALAAEEPPADAGRAVAVLYVDLDGLKAVNDRLGHAAGDALLVEVSRRLEACSRAGDAVARLGGDEFAVLCLDCSEDAADAVAQRFLAALDEPIVIDGEPIHAGASVGIAVGTDEVIAALPRRADRALYEAKRAGGRRVVTSD